MARDPKPTAPPLFIELRDGTDGVISVPAASIYEIHLKKNCTDADQKRSKVVVVRIGPDNTKSTVIAVWNADYPYYTSAAQNYYDRLTALVNVVRVSQWNRDPNAKSDSEFPL